MTASEVHALLLEAHPEVNNDNLAKAAHLAEATGVPHDHRQLETFVAIRNLRTVIESGAGATELETLLLHAISTAEQWVIAS
jgi:GMP synthase PP-ATPase subunit